MRDDIKSMLHKYFLIIIMVPPMFTRIPSGKILNEMMNLIEKKKRNNVLALTYVLVYVAISKKKKHANF